MPLGIVRCQRPWRLPEKRFWQRTKQQLNRKQAATEVIAAAIPDLLAGAINVYDKDRVDEELTPDLVFVDFGKISKWAINASNMQILLLVPTASPIEDDVTQARRRAVVRKLVYRGLRSIIQGTPDNPGSPFEWPKIDLEVGILNTTGFTINPNGEINAQWGFDAGVRVV